MIFYELEQIAVISALYKISAINGQPIIDELCTIEKLKCKWEMTLHNVIIARRIDVETCIKVFSMMSYDKQLFIAKLFATVPKAGTTGVDLYNLISCHLPTAAVNPKTRAEVIGYLNEY